MIPLSVPCITGNEWEYVKTCLDSGWVSTAGSFVSRFEEDFRRYTGAGHAIACMNGTAALHVALGLVGVTAGDEVLVPTLTFIASVNAISYLGASPVFMDCDEFYNIDVDSTREFLEDETELREGVCYNRRSGRRIAALVPVHVFGNAARVQELVPLCRERGIRIVEDAAESLGTVYSDGRHTGTIGDVGCFSFNGNKILTTGGGGMIVTDNAAYAERARYLTTQAKDDELHYVHNEVGYNYRLTNLQAALGVAQLEQLPRFLEIKRSNFEAYRTGCAGIAGLSIAAVPPYADNNCWMYALRIDRDRYGRTPEQVIQALGQQQIQTRPVWYLNHLQRPYRGCQAYRVERALSLYAQTINLPCSTSLTPADVDTVLRALAQ
ncbi:MAG: LegC family aminotransferase [Pseudomonadota bacterium]